MWLCHLVGKTWQFRCCTCLLESCIGCIHFLNSAPSSRSIYRSLSSLVPRRQSIRLSYNVLTILRENSSRRLQLRSRPDEKESRMLNRAFYGYEFALFRSPSTVLIDLPSHDYTSHESFAREMNLQGEIVKC